jgi:hypothetical protein
LVEVGNYRLREGLADGDYLRTSLVDWQCHNVTPTAAAARGLRAGGGAARRCRGGGRRSSRGLFVVDRDEIMPESFVGVYCIFDVHDSLVGRLGTGSSAVVAKALCNPRDDFVRFDN